MVQIIQLKLMERRNYSTQICCKSIIDASLSSKEKAVQVFVEGNSTENQLMYFKSTPNRLNEMKELNVNDNLSSDQVSDIKSLITDFSDVPGYISIEHVIMLETIPYTTSRRCFR